MVNFGKYYFNQKKRYTIDLYVVCNSNKKKTYMLSKYLNAIYDIWVSGQTKIHQNPLSSLLPGQYLLEDTAYTLTYIISLYKVFKANHVENTMFNK